MKYSIKILLFLVLFFYADLALSQNLKTATVSGDYEAEPAKKVLLELEKRLNVKFTYLDRLIENVYVTAFFRNKKISEALEIIFSHSNLSFKIYYEARNIVLFKSKIHPAHAIRRYTLSGYVEDAESGESLMGANVFDQRSRVGTTTNRYGFFSLTLPADSVFFTVSFIGYRFFQQPFFLNRDRRLKIQLQPVPVVGDTVQIVYSEQQSENQVWMGRSAVPVSQTQYLPELGGEMNILKTFHSLPSLELMGKGRSGLFIRGGSPDQNLILMDGVPVYNASHFLNLFPAFNPKTVQNIRFLKGGFPARFGGRVSSVVEISTKEGNSRKFKGQASVGFLSADFVLQGPIAKNKSSFILSGRRTYANLFGKTFLNDGNLSYLPFFYDVNAKWNAVVSASDRIYFSLYAGMDKFMLREQSADIRSKMNSNWENKTASLRWNHIVNPKLFANTVVMHSQYRFDVNLANSEPGENGSDRKFYYETYRSEIRDLGAYFNLNYLPRNDHIIRFGGGFIRHRFKPGIFPFSGSVARNDSSLIPGNIVAQEFNGYIEDEFELSRGIALNVGMHASLFAVTEGLYSSLQPRISIRYKISRQMALKSSYAEMAQYIHLLTNNQVGLPTDLWLPVSDRIKPLRSNQITIGIAKSWQDKYFEFSMEAYSKRLENLLTYQGVDRTGIPGYSEQNRMPEGTGYSRGVELFCQKRHGRTTGLLSYNLSWTNKNYAAFTYGREFPFRYDRRHRFTLALTHRFAANLELSANWRYYTGEALSLPAVKYVKTVLPVFRDLIKDEILLAESAGKNIRIQAYHQLDIRFRYYIKRGKNRQMLTIDIYNVYNRKNPYFLHFGNSSAERLEIKQVNLLPLIPFISYSFSF